jgi:hypothetical protein
LQQTNKGEVTDGKGADGNHHLLPSFRFRPIGLQGIDKGKWLAYNPSHQKPGISPKHPPLCFYAETSQPGEMASLQCGQLVGSTTSFK